MRCKNRGRVCRPCPYTPQGRKTPIYIRRVGRSISKSVLSQCASLTGHYKPCLNGFGVALEAAVVEVGSLHPNQPGVLQLVDELDVEGEEEGEEVLVADVLDVVVMIGAGAALGEVIVVVRVIVVGSLQPNQPGVLQDEVVRVLVIVVVGVAEVVVDSSRQPHQPGVLQVSVRVCEEVLEGLLDVVVDSLLLLSKNFQLKQSWHSTSSSQLGTVSYFSRTSLMTLMIRWVPTPGRQPRSPTVS